MQSLYPVSQTRQIRSFPRRWQRSTAALYPSGAIDKARQSLCYLPITILGSVLVKLRSHRRGVTQSRLQFGRRRTDLGSQGGTCVAEVVPL